MPFFGLSGVLQIEEKDNAKTRTMKQAKTIKPSFELSIKISNSMSLSQSQLCHIIWYSICQIYFTKRLTSKSNSSLIYKKRTIYFQSDFIFCRLAGERVTTGTLCAVRCLHSSLPSAEFSFFVLFYSPFVPVKYNLNIFSWCTFLIQNSGNKRNN